MVVMVMVRHTDLDVELHRYQRRASGGLDLGLLQPLDRVGDRHQQFGMEAAGVTAGSIIGAGAASAEPAASAAMIPATPADLDSMTYS